MLSTRRTARLVARMLTAVALTAGCITALSAPAAADTAPAVITLNASKDTAYTGDVVTLVVRSETRTLINEWLEIFDSTGGLIAACHIGTGTECQTSVSHRSGTFTYVAYLTTAYDPGNPPLSAQSVSNTETVTWVVPTLAFTATPPVNTVGGEIRLDAATEAGTITGTPVIKIWDITTMPATLVKTCFDITCTLAVRSSTVGTRQYHALLFNWNYPTYYPWAADADARVQAQWIDPLPASSSLASSLCDDGTQVVDSTTQGVHAKLYVEQVSPQETHVCVRVENGTDGIGFGGRFVVTPGLPGIGTLEIPGADTESGLCTATTPNGVPGQHPMTSGGVANTSYLVDAYSSADEAWVCLEAGATKIRVTIPVSVPDVDFDPAALIRFDPDPQTPDIL